jgi:hypothetical protein
MISILNNDKTKGLIKKAGCLVVCGALVFSLTGCMSKEVSTNSDINYDIIDTTSTEALENGITQVIEVPGQSFKLVVNYQCELQEDERWTVTSDKRMNMEIRTDGLPAGMQVYIDNIHTDTTICSYYPTVDGVTQDTMDDRIHNAQMLGFPISDSNAYYGINQIEGQNETFISGFVHGYNGYSSGSITEKRFLESDYLKAAVFANKITSVIDLIIVNGEEMTCVSVPSEVQVSVWPFIKMQKDDGTVYYKYYYLKESTGDMTYDELSEDEFLVKTQVEGLKKDK